LYYIAIGCKDNRNYLKGKNIITAKPMASKPMASKAMASKATASNG